jgi:hypothetical protein
MRRHEFIAGLGGAVAWPLAVRGQQSNRMRRVGVLMYLDENDPYGRVPLSGLPQGLAELGWTDGSNLRIDVRWAAAKQPDVILANSTPVTAALQRETRTIPIVFVGISDPVSSSFATSLPPPWREFVVGPGCVKTKSDLVVVCLPWPVADMVRCTPWAAMGHNPTFGVAKIHAF